MKVYTSNSTEYKTEVVKALGNLWAVTQASGQFNYVNVRKASNNPYGGLGKEFPTWDAAIANYKSPEMKGAIKHAQDQIESIK